MNKSILAISLSMIAFGTFAQTSDDTAKTVNVETPGTLSTLLPTASEGLYEIKNLTVTGQLNSADVKVLQAMAHVQVCNYGTPKYIGEGVLETLDLGGASFVTDKQPYAYDYYADEDCYTGSGSIGGVMFYGSTTLKKITLPENTRSVETRAFAQCALLEEVECLTPLKSFGASAFDGCTELEPIDLSEARSLAAGAFAHNLKIVDLDIPDACSSLNSSAFSSCTNLKNVVLGTGIVELDSYAFNNLPALESITFKAEEIKSLGMNSFNNLESLKSFTVCSNKVATFEPNQYAANPFQNLPETAVLYVPADLVETYKIATHWSTFKSIEPIKNTDTAVETIATDNDAIRDIYTLDGRILNSMPEKGLVIVRTASGKVMKIMK